jgi:hypothetical protein
VGEQLRHGIPLLFDAIAKQEPVSEAGLAVGRGLAEQFSDAVLGEPTPFPVQVGLNLKGLLALTILAVMALALVVDARRHGRPQMRSNLGSRRLDS